MLPTVERIAASAGQLAAGAHASPRSVDVNIPLPDGRLLTGTVAGVCDSLIRSVSFSRLAPQHRLAAWVRLIALTAARPELPWEAAAVGRARTRAGDPGVTIARIAPLAADATGRRDRALQLLMDLIELYDRGMREPLPIARQSSAAYAWAARTGGDPVQAARKQWTSEWNWDREDKDPEHRLVLGGICPFDVLLAQAPFADEDGWGAGEPTRFGRYARRLWDPLLEREELSDA